MSIRANVPIKLGPFVTIPVNLETAVEPETAYHNYCQEGHAPTQIKAPATCPECGNTNRATFLKGREVNGEIVAVTADALDAAKDDSLKEAMVVTVHDLDEVLARTVPSDKATFLTPAKGAGEGYAVLRELLASNPDKALVTQFAAKGKPAMYRLALFGEVVALHKLAWPGDLRVPGIVPVPITEEHTAFAQSLLGTLEKPFDPASYVDTSREAREDILVAQNAVSETVNAIGAAVEARSSLLDALRASVDEPKPKRAPRKKAEKVPA